jgi:hypothetical protein
MARTYVCHTYSAGWVADQQAKINVHSVGKRMGQIRKSADRIVFFEEKEITADAFQFPFPLTGNNL